jgi:hypothetical protein
MIQCQNRPAPSVDFISAMSCLFTISELLSMLNSVSPLLICDEREYSILKLLRKLFVSCPCYWLRVLVSETIFFLLIAYSLCI